MIVPASIMNELDRISLTNELEHEFIINANEPSPPSIFNAVVVSGSPQRTNNPNVGTAYGNAASTNSQKSSYYFVRMRRLDTDEFEKPSPFLAKLKNIARKLANMHPIGVLMKTAASDDPQGSPQEGDVWSCRYLTKDRKGIVLLNRIDVSKEFLSLETKDSLYQGSAAAWNRDRPQLLATYAPAGAYAPAATPPPVSAVVSQGKQIPGALNFTWSQLQELASLGIFEPLLSHIRGHECSLRACANKYFNRNQWDAFNYGKSGKYMGRTTRLSKPLSQYTIAQVRYMQDNNQSNLANEQIFAAGAYQIIPGTFQSGIDRIKGLSTGDQFDKPHQDALGVYLVTMKRRKLGKYLFGDNISAARAGNDLAYEFASIRLQKAATRDGVRIPAYSRYYGGVGVNKTGGIDKADATKTMNAINAVRQAIDNNARAREIRDLAI